MTELPTRRRSALLERVQQELLHGLVRFNRQRFPDGRLRTREDRAALPPLVDALRHQFGMFRRNETSDEWKAALAAERALALEDERMTAADKVAWVVAVDGLVAEWTEEERTAMENSRDETPATATADERRRRRLLKKRLTRQRGRRSK